MTNQDEALTISNPRFLSAAYFGLLAIVSTVTIDTILYLVGVEQILPTFQAILLAVATASCFGALFGKLIIQSTRPYRRKAFLYGFLMVLSAVPLYAFIFLYLLHKNHPQVFEEVNFTNLAMTYLFILLYSFLLAGLWLAIAAGLAAMYLRGHLVYDILHSKDEKIKIPVAKRPLESKNEPQSIKPQEENSP